MSRFGDYTIEQIQIQRKQFATMGLRRAQGAAVELRETVRRRPGATVGIAAIALGTCIAARRLQSLARPITRPGFEAARTVLRWQGLAAMLGRLRPAAAPAREPANTRQAADR